MELLVRAVEAAGRSVEVLICRARTVSGGIWVGARGAAVDAGVVALGRVRTVPRQQGRDIHWDVCLDSLTLWSTGPGIYEMHDLVVAPFGGWREPPLSQGFRVEAVEDRRQKVSV